MPNQMLKKKHLSKCHLLTIVDSVLQFKFMIHVHNIADHISQLHVSTQLLVLNNNTQ